jgi:hypothetical protein
MVNTTPERQNKIKRRGEVMIRKRNAKIAEAKSKTEAIVKKIKGLGTNDRIWKCTEPVLYRRFQFPCLFSTFWFLKQLILSD